MEGQRIIYLPAFFEVEIEPPDTGILKILNQRFKKIKKLFIVSDSEGARAIGEQVIEAVKPENYKFIKGGTVRDVIALEEDIKRFQPELIIGIGGGKVLDTVKLASYYHLTPFFSVPTTLSHDGILSPVAVIDFDGEVKSVGAHPPVGVYVSLEVIRNAPNILKLAGCGDLIANLSALEDWKLAHKYKKEEIDYFAFMLSKTGAKNILLSSSKPSSIEFLKDLAEGLAASGLSMIIARNSRPASGAEHLISHALDHILKEKRKPHGIQVGVATLFTQTLRKKNIEEIKRFFKKIGFPLTPFEIGIDKETFFKAIEIAPSMRKGRFTILDLVKDRKQLEQAFEIAYLG